MKVEKQKFDDLMGEAKQLSGKLTPAMVASLGIRKGWENALRNLAILVRRAKADGIELLAEEALEAMKKMRPR